MTKHPVPVRRQYFRLADEDEAINPDGTLRDGFGLRVPMMLRDNAGNPDATAADAKRTVVVDSFGNPGSHRPGPCYLCTTPGTVDHAAAVTRDYLRREAYDAYVRDLTTAWMRDGPKPCDVGKVREGGNPDRSQDSGMDPREAGYQQMCDELQNAWRR